jgi:hypothetical protein
MSACVILTHDCSTCFDTILSHRIVLKLVFEDRRKNRTEHGLELPGFDTEAFELKLDEARLWKAAEAQNMSGFERHSGIQELLDMWMRKEEE